MAIALARESDLLPVGRPGGVVVIGLRVGEPGGVRAVPVHHVDLEVAVAVGREGDSSSIGRPRRVVVNLWVEREPGNALAVRDVDVPVAVAVGHERDLGRGCATHGERDRHCVARDYIDGARVRTAECAVRGNAVEGHTVRPGLQPGDGQRPVDSYSLPGAAIDTDGVAVCRDVGAACRNGHLQHARRWSRNPNRC